MIVLLVYAGSLVSYYLLSGSQRALPPPDLGYSGDTIVQVTLQSMHPVDNRVDVKVRVIPADTLMDQRLQVLNTDISVRFYPPNTLGDVQYQQGQFPPEVATTMTATGDADDWPFDSKGFQPRMGSDQGSKRTTSRFSRAAACIASKC